MAKKKVKDLASEILAPFLQENRLELYNIEFVKEGKEKYLRIFIDKVNDTGDEEAYISIEDCEKVSRYLSEKLDEEDPIEENYFLEVSSPGLDRTLFKQADYDKYTGRLVDVGLYRPIEGSKLLSGTLLGLNNGVVSIMTEQGNDVKIPIDQITKTKLAVVF